MLWLFHYVQILSGPWALQHLEFCNIWRPGQSKVLKNDIFTPISELFLAGTLRPRTYLSIHLSIYLYIYIYIISLSLSFSPSLYSYIDIMYICVQINSSVTVLRPESWFWKMPASSMKVQPQLKNTVHTYKKSNQTLFSSENRILRKSIHIYIYTYIRRQCMYKCNIYTSIYLYIYIYMII